MKFPIRRQAILWFVFALLVASIFLFQRPESGGASFSSPRPSFPSTTSGIQTPISSGPTTDAGEAPGSPHPTVASGQNSAPELAHGPDCPHCQSGRVASTAPVREIVFPPATWDQIRDEQTTEIDVPVPGGGSVTLEVRRRQYDEAGEVMTVEGAVAGQPGGRFLFHRESPSGHPAVLSGDIHLFESEISYRLVSIAEGWRLRELPVDEIVCRLPAWPGAEAEAEPEAIPAEHPVTIPIPAYQNGVVPLQSLPGATAVLYLDFDGEEGPFTGWGDFDAARFNLTTSQIRDVWQRVAEDFAPFRINVTTDLAVFLAAPRTSRQQCIITPTKNAAPTAGGVAYVGDFQSSNDRVCWAFYGSGKNAAEVISHELGHTLGLSHDGRVSPSEEYYGGHGTDPVGWAPIMGVGYSKNLSQWSKGEYASANRTQDDIAIIAANTGVGLRADDAGDTPASARPLEIFGAGSVDDEGVISTAADVDVLAFTTTGGALSLAINQVSLGPNLDILAELKDSGGNTIASSNPAAALNGSLSVALGAGTYTLHVSGTGLGDPLGTGYSDYGSLGAYTITGSIGGVDAPVRLAIDENAPSGRTLGVVSPLNNHGAAALVFSILSGNTGGVFAINPASGEISTQGALDFEALSPGWDRPASFTLAVGITNTENPSLDETRRVVVTVNDVNEAPVAIGGRTGIPVGAMAGASVLTVPASDPDRFDSLSFSITSGNSSGLFAINSGGRVGLVASPPANPATHTLGITVSDTRSPARAVTVEWTVDILTAPPGGDRGFGRVERVIYDGISGSTVGNLTSNAKYPLAPDRMVVLPELAGGTEGDSHGSVVRALLFAPVTGSYTFWIAGDDAAQLFLNPTGATTAGTAIASVSGGVNPRDWTASPAQQSVVFPLTAGQLCYLEVRHKESTSFDHVAVAWQAVSGGETLIPRQVIPSANLAPSPINYRPKLVATAARVHRGAYTGSTIGVVAANDANSGDSITLAITGGNTGGVFGIDPLSGRVFVADATALMEGTAATYSLAIQATDNGSPALSSSANLAISVTNAGQPAIAGPVQEIWDGIGGTSLATLTSNGRWPDRPDRLRDLTSLDSGSGIGDSYGARIRAYVVPPATGSYTFHIAADDQAALFLGTGPEPSSATQVASVSSWVDEREFTANASQSSAPVSLVAGQRYFIEARVKEGSGGDHVSVGWTGPGISTIVVPSAADVRPFDTNLAPVFPASVWPMSLARASSPGTIVGQVGATVETGETKTFALLDGDPAGAFRMDALTGELVLVDPMKLSIEPVQTLVVGVQDNGRGYRFPPREATSTIEVSLLGTPVNAPPGIQRIRPGRPDPVIGAGHGLVLEVAATDDGLPLDGGLSLAWSLVSGPSPVEFSAPAGATTETVFGLPGVYRLRCTADDGELTTVLEMEVTVGPGPGNAAPLLSLPEGLVFDMPEGRIPAGVTDDGLPLGNAVILPAGSNAWRYRKGTSAASSPAAAWRDPDFPEDATWLPGGLPIGYGESGLNTTISDMRNSYTSVYLRREFQLEPGRVPDQLALDLTIDDGVVVWINGVEVARQNVRAGELAHTDRASSAPSDPVAGSYSLANTRSFLREGRNVIAMHLFNGTLGSSDLFANAVLSTASLPAVVSLSWSRVSGPGNASFTNPDQRETGFSATEPGRHRLRLTANDGVTTVFREMEVDLVAPVLPIADWRVREFGGQAADPAVAGDSADPDGDGLVNLLEYAFGLDPQASDPATARPELRASGDRWFFHFRRDTLATGITLTIEQSTAAAGQGFSWVPVTNAPEPLGEENGIGLWRVEVPGPPTHPAAYFRVRVIHP